MEKPVLAGHMPRQDEPDEPVPRFIMWVPQMNDRMPGIGDDAPGARIRVVSFREAPPARPHDMAGEREPLRGRTTRSAGGCLPQAGPRDVASAARSGDGRAKR
jgi:hypothetical protein